MRLRQSFRHAHERPIARKTFELQLLREQLLSEEQLRVPGLVAAQALAGDGLQVWLRPEGGGQRFALVGVDQFAQAEFPRRVQTVADIGLTGLTVALHHS